ncbi:response regulator transcription factor [Amycolatopsis samaneae]|uniref:Response regulator transcription factor n=1 Tax=Amycolatopsis samaneae TaxID=664691 RepID=A0ABW5GC77_9PSEU
MRLLVVEDDPTLRDLLSASLRFAGFTVSSAGSGAEALAAAKADVPDLVVLDVMLPDLDGFEVLRRLRTRGARLPVLFLTARDADEDLIAGLTGGADDYVTKPFKLEELIARIRAILRRRGTTGAVAGLELDAESHSVVRGGTTVTLSPTEFTLLSYLVEHAGQVLSRAQILRHVWKYEFGGDASIIDSYISYLRRKIDTTEPRLIHTVRGVGYVLRGPK